MSKRRIAIYIVALIAVFGLCVGLADFKKVREQTRRQTISGTDAGQTVQTASSAADAEQKPVVPVGEQDGTNPDGKPDSGQKTEPGDGNGQEPVTPVSQNGEGEKDPVTVITEKVTGPDEKQTGDGKGDDSPSGDGKEQGSSKTETGKDPKNTPSVTPVVKNTPSVTPSAKPTPEPVKPEPINTTLYTANEVYYEQPKAGVIRMGYYLRSDPGRTAERVVKLSVGTPVLITCSCTNLFHEPWYGVRVTVDDVTYTGYVQQSTTELGDEVTVTEKTMPLLPVTQIDDPKGRLGGDKNGDGIYVVVLDPGHGGVFSGASHYGTNEKAINLKTAQYCKKYLEEHYTNVKVYMTRTGDYVYDSFDADDDLEYRVRYAIDHGADLILSLHYNAYNGKQSGAMALVARKSNVFEKERMFASYLLKEMKELGIPSAGIKRKESAFTKYLDGTPMDGYLILRLSAEVGIPACIIEHCFMDNRNDRKFWDTEEKIKALGEADAKAIAAFLKLSTEPLKKDEPKGNGDNPGGNGQGEGNEPGGNSQGDGGESGGNGQSGESGPSGENGQSGESEQPGESGTSGGKGQQDDGGESGGNGQGEGNEPGGNSQGGSSQTGESGNSGGNGQTGESGESGESGLQEPGGKPTGENPQTEEGEEV